MRFLVIVSPPIEAVNESMQDGKFASTMQDILDEIKPEAAYFTEMDGYRTAVLVVNIAETHEMAKIAEPFFHAFAATVEFHPAMNTEDLIAAEPHFKSASKKYG
jgi:hypothetical protein